MKTNELLAPVGSKESLLAAINAGADAVFLSGPYFGARAEKANFSYEDLQWAVDTIHLYGLKIYITLNTLIKENELESCYRYIDKIISMSVDAIIVQDLAVITYIRRHYPKFEIHGSTQMSIYNQLGLENAKKLGLKRVVLARELNYQQIKKLIDASDIEVEVFVHGALCHAFSGQCLISSIVGGRSANRGKCAQTCRMKFDFENSNIYAMSMKDLTSIDNLALIKALGISSFKIEGRLRSSDYVYHTIKAYRAALDGEAPSALEIYKDNMNLAFNRSYTKGHLFKADDLITVQSGSNKGELIGHVTKRVSKYKLALTLEKDLFVGDAIKFWQANRSMGTEIYNLYQKGQKQQVALANTEVVIDYSNKVDVGVAVYRTRSKYLNDLRTTEKNQKKIAISLTCLVDSDSNLKIVFSDGEHFVEVVKYGLERASKRPLDKDLLYRQLNKLGDTPFFIDKFDVDIKADVFIAASELNALRRQAIEKLIEKRLSRTAIKKMEQRKKECIRAVFSNVQPKIIALISTEEQYHALKGEDILLFSEDKALCQAYNIDFAVRNMASSVSGNAALVTNLGHLIESGKQYIDYHSQIMNTASFDALKTFGAFDICLSPELNEQESLEIARKRPVRLFAYGRLAVMYSQSCIKKQSGQDCKTCSKSFRLKNKETGELIVDCDMKTLRYNTEKPIVKSYTWMRSSAPLLLRFTFENGEETRAVMEAIKQKRDLKVTAYPHYQKKIL